MLSKDEFNDVIRRRKAHGMPAMLGRLARSENFVTVAVLEKALDLGTFPKHGPGSRPAAKELEYRLECLAYLRDLRSIVDGAAEGAPVLSDDGPPQAVAKTRRSVPPPAGTVRMTVNIPRELHAGLRIKALKCGTTLTEMIVEWARGAAGDGT
jgi:hypothetical protein